MVVVQRIVRVASRLVGSRQYYCKDWCEQIDCIGCLSITENIGCCQRQFDRCAHHCEHQVASSGRTSRVRMRSVIASICVSIAEV